MRIKHVFLIIFISLMLSTGCGGGGGGGSVSMGRVTVTVQWPGRSRYIPPYANSIVCRITPLASPTLSLTLNRTGDQAHEGTGTFAQEVPFGSQTMLVSAYSQTGGQGSVVAQASLTVQVTAGQTTSLDISADIQSTIDHLKIDGTPLTVKTGNSLQINAHAEDAQNQIILLPTAALSWDITSGNAVGTIDPASGMFTSLSAGTATVRVSESGAQKSVTANVIVADTLSGAQLVVSVDWPGRSRYIPPYANSVVCTLTISGSEVYTVTINRTSDSATNGTGVFSQTLPAGTYNVALEGRTQLNGAGAIVATVTVPVTLVSGHTTTRNVTADMQSTISRLVIDGQPLTVQVPGTLQITGHAEDAQNNAILLPQGALVWDITTGTASGTINAATGLYTSALGGTATVRLRELGAAKSATASITVGSAPPAVTVYVADFTNVRIAQMNDITGAGWQTLTAPGTSVAGIAFDSIGRIYWTDSLSDVIYRADDISGTNTVSYGSSGSSSGQFTGPAGIAIDSTDRIYVADRFNNRIVRINDMSGAGWTTLGNFGSNPGQFYVPEGVFVTSDGTLYVADTGNCRIVQTAGMTTTGWTTLGDTRGSGTNQFDNPVSVFVNNAGVIYVADAYNNRIVQMSGINGSGWSSLGGPLSGSGTNQFDTPSGVVADSLGYIYISDMNNSRIVRVTRISGLGWTSLGAFGSGTNQFGAPVGIALR